MRGGEKVLLSLLRLFPDATLHTLLHVRGSVAPEIETRSIEESFIGRLPAAESRYRAYLPLFPLAIEGLDVSGADLVISSSHCAAKSVLVRPDAVHVCYCHTPMRYVWDRFDDYFGPGRFPALLRPAAHAMAAGLRAWDRWTAAGVDHFVANSAYVAGRIARYYGREAEVIPPPVDTDFFTPGADPTPGDYDLVVSALVPYKRLELVLEAYRGSGRQVRLVGTGPEAARLQAQAPTEALFLGRVDDVALRELYRGCRAVLMPNVEDFGIVPVEAMACGRPAVVFAEGGGAESVLAGETGLVFDDPTPRGLRAAVDALSTVRFNPLALRSRAESFSRDVFERRIRACVDRALGARRAQAEGTLPRW
ncbi:MAG: glycosyltransferase [Vicinamibacteria bacterium]|nr:glycosyltransferase [Vicinamibacteria bacterium]